jgi:hypothetical protein
VNRSRSRNNFTTVRHAARDEKFFASLDDYPLSPDQQGITALHYHQIFIEFMDMLLRAGSFRARPKRHLAPIGSVEHIPFDTGCGLISLSDPVGGIPHERGKCIHTRRLPQYLLCSGKSVSLSRAELLSPDLQNSVDTTACPIAISGINDASHTMNWVAFQHSGSRITEPLQGKIVHGGNLHGNQEEGKKEETLTAGEGEPRAHEFSPAS